MNIEKKVPAPTVDHIFASYSGAAINSMDGAKDDHAPLEVNKTGSDHEHSPPLTTGDMDGDNV